MEATYKEGLKQNDQENFKTYNLNKASKLRGNSKYKKFYSKVHVAIN